ncbi:MAG: alpha-2-macroglobulin [Bacteroidales bacterium]|nr:alpha-2-macroglobulin [Bacteroidales bacterium]
MKKSLRVLLLAAGLISLLFSCDQNKETIPSMDFAPYISAYTGGVISSDGLIRIIFTQDMDVVEPGKSIEQKLFSFSPSLKGKCYWEDNHTMVFAPDSGELKQGKLYKGTFHLSELYSVDRKLRQFHFSFRVREKEYILQMLPMEITAAHPNEVTLRGQLLFNEPVRQKEVQQMLSIQGSNAKIQFLDDKESNQYNFIISGIEKKSQPYQLQLTVNGKPIGIKEKSTTTIEIPARNQFTLLDCQPMSSTESAIQLVFDEAISTEQDIRGLIEISDVTTQTMIIKENVVEIHYQLQNAKDSIPVRINKSLQSASHRHLQQDKLLYVKIQPIKPQVELLSEGVILPNADNLTLNFRAVSLEAVDVEVVRIYENNILTFLQTNRLNESDEIRRAGRLICKQRLLLSTPELSANTWHNYAVDLSKLFRQEEGAMYRIRISFKREYASAPFIRQPLSGKQNEGMTLLTPAVSKEDEAAWDQTGYYLGYPYEDIDYSEYNWKEINNPYTASYYLTNRSVSTNLLASNLGVIVKGNDNNNYWIVVNNILTTEPVRGATVTLYNLQLQKIASAKTDGKGQATLKTNAKPFIAVVSKDKQNSYLRLVEGENNSYSRFDVGGEQINNGLKGFIYGERGVWRPGDTLYLTLIVEDKNHQLPENHPASLELFNPRGQFVLRKVNASSVDGFYTFAIPTSSDAPTGIWNAYAKVGQATFHKALHIETVKANRLNINFKLPDTILNVRNTIAATLHAAWLTGAQASDLQAQVEMNISKRSMTVKGYEQYVFTNPLVDFSPKTIRLYDGKLSKTGLADIAIKPLASDQYPGKIQAQFICRVIETGGDASVVSKNAVLSPYPTYVGIRSNLNEHYPYIEINKEHKFDVVTLTDKGKLVNCNGLKYFIYKIDWSYWWEFDESELSSYIDNTNIHPVKSGTLSTINGKASIPFRVDDPEYGKYLIFIKDPIGGHATGCLFNVDWPSWRGNPDGRNPSSVQMLTFSLDKKEYEVGEEVLITIPKLKSGTALISIENGSQVLATHRIKIKPEGTTNYRFTVTEDMTPNAYVQISVLQPHQQTVDNLPIRLYGVEPFTVTDSKTMLTPIISCPSVVRPQTSFNINVKEKSGRPMTYTLALVDEGLLSLTNYKTPDPWNKFHAREALGIRTWDIYNDIIGTFAGKYARMFSVGGDENMEISPAKANRFHPVVRFIGPFTLKKGETKNHTVNLPQYIGAVRVMVVAGKDGAYGSTEKNINVRAPLMLLSSLPRVVSINERIELPVNIFAMENDVKDVNVKVETGSNILIKGVTSQKVNFSHTGDKMAYFTLETGNTTGKAKITISATANGHHAKEVVELEIRNPNPLLTQTSTVLIERQKTATLPYLLSNIGKESLLQMEVSTLPNLNIAGQFDFLENYRHACSEQLVSKTLPLLFKNCFRQMTEAEKKEADNRIKECIKNLYSRQQPSGGFSYWPNDRQASEWLTSYVGHLLILAKENGYEVNQNVFNQWLAYQRKTAQHWQAKTKNAAGYTQIQSDLEQAYRLYTLALAGTPETGAMNRLKGLTTLSTQARWRLAAAYAVAGNKKTSIALIQHANSKIAPYNSDNSTFGSSLRDEAMILETMVLTDLRKEAFQQAKLLAQQLKDESTYTTHATAYAILAIAQLYEQFSDRLHFEWHQDNNNSAAVQTDKNTYQKQLPLKKTAGQVFIQNKGEGTLYASLYQRCRPLNDTASPRSSNIALNVSYTNLAGNPIDPKQLPQGTDFWVTIRVSNTHPSQQYPHVALTYIVPSGWEIVNERYLNGAETGSSSGISYQDIRDDRVLTYFNLPQNRYQEIKLRLRAAYCGDYILPAVKCEAMYDPQAYARTAAGRAKVTR